MRDPYEILGLAKTASAAEIKSAYRSWPRNSIRQSKEPKAKDRFAEIGAAYKLSATRKSAERSTAAKSTRKASRAIRL